MTILELIGSLMFGIPAFLASSFIAVVIIGRIIVVSVETAGGIKPLLKLIGCWAFGIAWVVTAVVLMKSEQ